MYCSYHTSSRAHITCTHCGRGLCEKCDHRIRGYPYCQDCIVSGIENLSRHSTGSSRAVIATLCSLVPGLGAVYNRQNLKALLHFIAVTGLFQLTALHPAGVFFALAGLVFYFYTMFDACRTAVAIDKGEDPAVSEARLRHLLVKRAPAAGTALMLAGALVFIRIVHPFGLDISLLKLLPAAMVLLGGYMVVSWFRRGEAEEVKPWQHPPRQLTGGQEHPWIEKGSGTFKYTGTLSDGR